jgi:hypothetical protein
MLDLREYPGASGYSPRISIFYFWATAPCNVHKLAVLESANIGRWFRPAPLYDRLEFRTV